jgi:hypothetical protein
VQNSTSIDISALSLRRSVSDCGNLDVDDCFGFEIATPCCARFAMTTELDKPPTREQPVGAGETGKRE